MSRAGRRTRREVRQERMAFLRKHWRWYLVLAALITGLGSLPMMFMSPLMRAYFAGVFSMLFLSLVAYSLMIDGSHFQALGAEAERWTAQAFRKLAGWRVIDGVEFFDGDIDHVAVGPSHVLAVETKWTSRKVQIDEHGVHGLWRDGVDQAAKAADRVRNFLASKGIRQPITPVLILWGPRIPDIEGGYVLVDDVRVLIGKQASEWQPRLHRLPHWSHSTVGIADAIEEYVQNYDRRNRLTWRARVLSWVNSG